MDETQEIIGKTLIALGQTVLENGFPKKPLIAQGEPGKSYGFFVAIWPNIGDRAEDVFTLKKR